MAAGRAQSAANADFADWAAALWAAGRPVLYQPAACAARVDIDPDRDDVDAAKQSWASALHGRHDAPEVCDDDFWRTLLVNDDIGGCWT